MKPASPSTPPPTTESGAPIGQGVFEIIDLGRELRPGAGFSFETLAEGIQSELVSGFEADPNVVELVGAVGTSVMTDGSDKTLLIVLVLKRPLVRQELKDFIAGVIGGGTEVDQGAVAGTRPWPGGTEMELWV